MKCHFMYCPPDSSSVRGRISGEEGRRLPDVRLVVLYKEVFDELCQRLLPILDVLACDGQVVVVHALQHVGHGLVAGD